MEEREDATYLLLVNEGRTWVFSNKESIAHPVEITLTHGVSVIVRTTPQIMMYRPRTPYTDS